MVVVLAAGLLITVVVVDRHTLAQSLSAIGGVDWRWIVLAIACEVVSLLAFGFSRRMLLQADGHKVRLGSVMAITYAGTALSMSIPFAGAQLAAVFSYRQFRRRGLDPALTGWALGVSAIASSSALALVLVVGALAGGAALATAIGFLGAAVFALPAITVILALRYPRARVFANRVLTWALRLVQRIFRRPGMDPAALDELLERLASIHLGWPRYAEVFGLAVANWLFDCGCLACAIKATGQPVPWHGLLLAYGSQGARRQHRRDAGRVPHRGGRTDGGAGGGRAERWPGAGRCARLPADQLLDDPLGGGVVLIFLSRKRDSQIRPYQRTGDESSPNGEATPRGAAQRTADRPG